MAQRLTQELFDNIYQAAKNLDNKVLAEIVAAGHDLDGLEFDNSPIGRLAAESDHNAVNFLINEFQVSTRFVIHGYGKSGHAFRVNQLLRAAKEDDMRYAMLAREAVIGATHGCHHDLANDIINDELNEIRNFPLKKAKMRTYAQVATEQEDIEKINRILAQEKDVDKKFSLLKYVCVGYFENKNIAQAFLILNKVLSLNELTKIDRKEFLKTILPAWARCGKVKEIKDFLDELLNSKLINNIDLFECEKCIVTGLALRGEVNQVNQRIDAFHDKPLKEFALMKCAIRCYAVIGKMEEVHKMIDQYDEVEKRFDLVSCATMGCASVGDIKSIEKLLPKQFNFQEMGDCLVKTGAVESSLRNEWVEQIDELFKQENDELTLYAMKNENIYTCASKGYTHLVNVLIQQAEENDEDLFILVRKAKAGFEKSKYFKETNFEENILRLITLLDNEQLRHSLLESISQKKSYCAERINEILQTSNQLKHIMKIYGFDFDQAQVLMMTEKYEWLIIANQMVTQSLFPREIIHKLTVSCIGLSYGRCGEMLQKVNENIYTLLRGNVLSKYKYTPRLFSETSENDNQVDTVGELKMKKELTLLEERYQKRMFI